MTNYARLVDLYETGSLPWDQPLPPPEVLDLAAQLPPGRALDLGCGLGRAALYLARLGWQVDGVDFIPQAVAQAKVRAEEAGLTAKVWFQQGSVTQLDFLQGPYDLALDVGCAHGLSLAELNAYQRELLRLLKPAATYLLFARLNDLDAETETQLWLDDAVLRQVFATGFILERVEYGQTQVNGQAPWRSAWFWFKKIGN